MVSLNEEPRPTVTVVNKQATFGAESIHLPAFIQVQTVPRESEERSGTQGEDEWSGIDGVS